MGEGGGSHLCQRLPHRGERWRGKVRQHDVVESHHGYVIPDAQPGIADPRTDAKGAHVVDRDDRGGRVGFAEQFLCGGPAKAGDSCTGQLPRNGNSGAMESRGSFNVFRDNKIFANAAAGIRLGGDLPGDAVGNSVYHNEITGNARGGIKVQDFGPHGQICGNVMSGNVGGNAVGTYKDQIGDPTAPC